MMKRVALVLVFCISLGNPVFAQGGMGPGPGTMHSTGGGGSTIALIANLLGTCGNGTSSALNTTGANLLVVTTGDGGGTATVTDSLSNTWTALTAYGVTPYARIYYAKNATVGAAQTFTISGGFPSFEVLAFSNASTTAPFDVQNGNNSSLQPGSVTPTNNGSVLVTNAAYSTGTLSVDSGFTITDQRPLVGGTCYGSGAAYKIQTTKNAENPTWSVTPVNSGQSSIAVFTP